MGFPSLIDRELRSAARNPRTYRLRLAAGILGALVGLALILPGAHNIALIGSSSRGVFWWMSGLMLAYGMGMALFLAGDALPSERQTRTLELLRLTRLSPFELLLGKVVSTGLGAMQGILAFSLTLAIAILAGGVTLGEYGRVMALTMNAVFLALSVGLLTSCFIREGRMAAIGGLILLLLICTVPLLIHLKPAAGPGPARVSFWELVSPLSSFKLADPFRSGFAHAPFWISLVIQHLLSWSLLGFASGQLRRTWTSEKPPFSVQIGTFLRSQQQLFDQEDKDDKDTMDDNPILWLLVRKYGSAWYRLLATAILILVSAVLFFPSADLSIDRSPASSFCSLGTS